MPRTICTEVMSHIYDGVMAHVSRVMAHISQVMAHIFGVMAHVSHVTFHSCLRSHVTNCMWKIHELYVKKSCHTNMTKSIRISEVMSRVSRVMAHIFRAMLHVSGASDMTHVWTMHELYVKKSCHTHITESCPVSIKSWLISLDLCCMFEEPVTWHSMYEWCTNCVCEQVMSHTYDRVMSRVSRVMAYISQVKFH